MEELTKNQYDLLVFMIKNVEEKHKLDIDTLKGLVLEEDKLQI